MKNRIYGPPRGPSRAEQVTALENVILAAPPELLAACLARPILRALSTGFRKLAAQDADPMFHELYMSHATDLHEIVARWNEQTVKF
jgi:hypothetical protein